MKAVAGAKGIAVADLRRLVDDIENGSVEAFGVAAISENGHAGNYFYSSGSRVIGLIGAVAALQFRLHDEGTSLSHVGEPMFEDEEKVDA